MKKKGFTLIELLAVIVILAIIALIAVPTVLNIIERAREGAAKSSATSYIKAVETYIVTSKLDKKLEQLEAGETYTTSKLNNLVELKGTKPTDGSVVISNKNSVASATLTINNYVIIYDGENYTVQGKETETPKVLYTENILNGTDPVLEDELIPVIIANDGTVTYADIYSKWYSYEAKEWANAVILIDSPSKTYKVGDKIDENDIESYFVWIPKYSYKIFDLGNYESAPSGTAGESIAHPIEIRFGISNTTDTETECATPLVSGESGTCGVNDYMTHPAFITMNTNGLWVGKFETGYSGATSPTSAEVTSSDESKIIVKPNVYSWRNNTVYNMFVSSYDYNRNLDSHMMKNTEWGAVAYLSHSIYGINKEININNNSSYKTGYSSLTTLDQSTYPGTSGDGSSYNNPYNTEVGYLASTTGNITGVYDMSGGSHEYMASYMSGQLGNSGFTTTTLANYNAKYFDVYSASSTITSYKCRILGDATGEMGPFIAYKDTGDQVNRYHNEWYADGSHFVESSAPWFNRGGQYNNGVLTGQFDFDNFTGGPHYAILGSRLVLAP